MAVLEYFAGNHVEVVTAIATSVAITASAVWLFTQSHSGFALAFLITTALAAVLISAGFASLLARDTARAEGQGAVVRTGQPAAIMAGEEERMVVVLSKCRYYR